MPTFFVPIYHGTEIQLKFQIYYLVYLHITSIIIKYSTLLFLSLNAGFTQYRTLVLISGYSTSPKRTYTLFIYT